MGPKTIPGTSPYAHIPYLVWLLQYVYSTTVYPPVVGGSVLCILECNILSHSQEVEAGVELRLGGEVQVFRSNDGTCESGVDGLEVRLLDAPFLRSQQETRIDHITARCSGNHSIMAT